MRFDEALWNTIRPDLLKSAVGLADCEDDAEDLVQDVCVSLMCDEDCPVDLPHLRNLAFLMLGQRWLDRLKSHAHSRVVASLDAMSDEEVAEWMPRKTYNSYGEAVSGDEIEARLIEDTMIEIALENMTDTKREALVLSALGLNSDEVSSMIEVSARTVRRWISGEAPVIRSALNDAA